MIISRSRLKISFDSNGIKSKKSSFNRRKKTRATVTKNMCLSLCTAYRAANMTSKNFPHKDFLEGKINFNNFC